jgi:ketosteroid isomerase-like protein
VSSANVELARHGYQAALDGDLGALREFLAPDVKWHGGDPTASGACTNRGQAMEFITRAREAGRMGELVEVIDAGDQVVVVMRTPAAGGALRANLTTIRDGKAVEMVAFESPEAALAAAGVAPQT